MIVGAPHRSGKIGLTFLLLALALVLPAQAGPPRGKDVWRRVDTPNFAIFGNVSPEHLVETGHRMEIFRDVLMRTTSGLIDPADDLTTIYVFRDTASSDRYLAWVRLDPSRFGGYLVASPHAGVDASGKKTLGATLRHQYVHALLENSVPDAPVCIEEGLADFYSTVNAPPGQPVALIGAPNLERVVEFRGTAPLPIDLLLSGGPESQKSSDKRDKAGFYAQCWGLTHWLIVPDGGRRERFMDFLGRIRRGELPLDAFRAALAIEPEALEEELSRYGRSETFESLSVTFDPTILDRELRATPVGRAETHYRHADLLTLGVVLPSADVEANLRAALALEPGRVDVQLDLARLYARSDRWDKAQAMLERALEKGGNAARVRYGQLLLSRAVFRSSPDERPKEVTRARELFREVLAEAPDDLSALSGLGKSCEWGEIDRSEGIAALSRARRLKPSRLDFVEDLIGLLATDGRLEEAGALFDELRARTTAFSPIHSAEWGVALGARRFADARRESGDEAGALAALRAAFDLVKSPELRSNITHSLESCPALASERPHLARYRKGVEALSDKKTHDAMALFEQVAAESNDPALQNAAREAAGDIRPAVVHDRVVVGHRAAMDLTRLGDVAGAARALEALLAEYGEMAETDRARITADLDSLRKGVDFESKTQPTMLKREGNRVVRTADGMEMVEIPAGTFWMGSEVHVDDGKPIHRVRISRDFLMDRHEVTVGQYARVMWTTPEGQVGGPDTPVTMVTWGDAREFCERVGGRLPTEAEWEYAARGTLRGKKYPWGNNEICAEGKCRANFCDRNCAGPSIKHLPSAVDSAPSDDGYGKTSPVCHYGESGYGLCDMIGNVREWTADWYGKYSPEEAIDPSGPPSGDWRVTRGGSFGFWLSFLSVANRFSLLPGERFDDLGFRCVRDSEPRPQAD